MTIRELYVHCTNIDEDTVVQLFKSKESAKYYAHNCENLSFVPMVMKDIKMSSATVRNFWLQEFNEDGFVKLIYVLLEDDKI